jgi:hypothetical protein
LIKRRLLSDTAGIDRCRDRSAGQIVRGPLGWLALVAVAAARRGFERLTEFDSHAQEIFDARFVGANQNYRAYRFTWSARRRLDRPRGSDQFP